MCCTRGWRVISESAKGAYMFLLDFFKTGRSRCRRLMISWSPFGSSQEPRMGRRRRRASSDCSDTCLVFVSHTSVPVLDLYCTRIILRTCDGRREDIVEIFFRFKQMGENVFCFAGAATFYKAGYVKTKKAPRLLVSIRHKAHQPDAHQGELHVLC